MVRDSVPQLSSQLQSVEHKVPKHQVPNVPEVLLLCVKEGFAFIQTPPVHFVSHQGTCLQRPDCGDDDGDVVWRPSQAAWLALQHLVLDYEGAMGRTHRVPAAGNAW